MIQEAAGFVLPPIENNPPMQILFYTAVRNITVMAPYDYKAPRRFVSPMITKAPAALL